MFEWENDNLELRNTLTKIQAQITLLQKQVEMLAQQSQAVKWSGFTCFSVESLDEWKALQTERFPNDGRGE